MWGPLMALVLERVELDRKRFHLGPIDLEVPAASWLSIVGESGSGKTTLLNCISGLLRPTHGTININGENVTEQPPERRPCTACQQDPLLFPVYSVLDNLCFPLTAAGHGKNEAREIARKNAPHFRISENLLKARGDAVSGGEARRIALGRAFMRKFQVALLDEVTNGLDEETQRVILSLLSEHFLSGQSVFVFVSHDPVLALSTASLAESHSRTGFVAVMRGGKIAQLGAPNEIYNQPIDLYVARLFGTVSVLHGQLIDGRLVKDGAQLDVPFRGQRTLIAVRAEHAIFELGTSSGGSANGVTSASICQAMMAGPYVKVELDTPFGRVTGTYRGRDLLKPGTHGRVNFEDLLSITQG